LPVITSTENGGFMKITDFNKSIIPFRQGDAKKVGKDCYYVDMIVWLNGDQIELGDNIGFNYGCYINGFGGLIIEDGSRLGPITMIHTANHIIDNVDAGIDGQGWIKKPVHIERDVGVTMGVIILPGVRIGEGSLIGAGSVVTKDIPPYSIAVGNPCKVIKSRK
jgi:maltose O-acetyltransferase